MVDVQKVVVVIIFMSFEIPHIHRRKEKQLIDGSFFSDIDKSILLENMSEDNNNNNEQCSTFSEQDKELASKAKQEYEAGQYDGLC